MCDCNRCNSIQKIVSQSKPITPKYPTQQGALRLVSSRNINGISSFLDGVSGYTLDSTIPLQNGTGSPVIPVHLYAITYREASNHFYVGSVDVTEQIPIEAKLTIAPDFDREKYALEVYNKNYPLTHGGKQAMDTGSTSILSLFATGLGNDLNPFNSGGAVNSLVKFGMFCGAGFLIYKYLQTQPKKR